MPTGDQTAEQKMNVETYEASVPNDEAGIAEDIG